MTVFKRPNGKFVAQVYDPRTGRPRQVGTFATKREARTAEGAAMEVAHHTGRETVKSFQARWVRDYPRPKTSTNQHNAERTRAFAADFERRRMETITVEDARRWALAQPGTLPAVRAMFNDARRSGIIATNPFSGLGIRRGRGRRDLPGDWLTAADVEGLEQTALAIHGDYGPTMAAMIRFASETGIRPGELFAVEHGDLGRDTLTIRRAADSKTRTITTPKNGKPREVPLTARARDAAQQAARAPGQALVFVSPQRRPFFQSTFAYVWNPVRKAAGRPTMAFHELRHYAATRLIELGLSPADVAVQLGHTDGGALIMSTYGHPSERAARGRILAALEGHEQGDIADFRRRRAG